MEPQEYDEIIRHLVRIAVHQEAINQRMDGFMAQQVEINQRLEVTHARIETLLARMLRQDTNGLEA
jgi:hypothetical protein